MVESNCPWCEIRPPHASSEHLKGLSEELQEIYRAKMVKEERSVEGKGIKGRKELCATGQVAW